MVSYKPVSIFKGSFAFCRYSIAVMVWMAFAFHTVILLEIVAGIFLLSAILKVKKAPMIWIYDSTFNKIWRSPEIMVNENAIYFAHLAGLALSVTCLIIVFSTDKSWAWFAVLAFALLKTISAFGFCPASKLYDCALNGNCCVRHKS